jgi:Microtubule-associated protein CRIPT
LGTFIGVRVFGDFLEVSTRRLHFISSTILVCSRPVNMSTGRSAVTVSKRSATTTATAGPSKSSTSQKKDDPNKPCKLCAQETVLAAPTVKRKNDPSTAPGSWQSPSGTSDGRKIGENKLLSKASKNSRYLSFREAADLRFSPYGGTCESCGGRTNRGGAKYCHTCAYQKGTCV